MINGSARKLIKLYSLQTVLHNTFPSRRKDLVRGGELKSFPREIFPPLPHPRRRLRERSIYDPEINQIGFINSQSTLIASDTVFSVSMQPWKYLTLICCWHEMSFTSRLFRTRRLSASAVVYAMLPQAALTAQPNTMSSILKTLGNRKLPSPDPSLLVSITNQKENKVASLVITFTFNFGGFCVFAQSKTKVYSIIAFYNTQLCSKGHAGFLLCWVHESAAKGDELSRGRAVCFITLCGRRWWTFEFVHEGLVFRMKRVVCYEHCFVHSWSLI